jgi:nickel-dependent lactate racemase
MIQAHKALETASHACRDGGTIILLAECADGLGKADLLKWFEASDSTALAETLCDKYQVNGQTAWSLLKKAERFNIRMVTQLDIAAVEKMRLSTMTELSLAAAAADTSGYIVPNGAKFAISG